VGRDSEDCGFGVKVGPLGLWCRCMLARSLGSEAAARKDAYVGRPHAYMSLAQESTVKGVSG
jgi:hypothetical protein